ncbi:ankyrin repeat domain-containing protein [Treponema sp.]|uniref:ankyrin repeat domain-containing protein n=1 Tax=Treponema sp. TaxID=166 RepID=UPI0025FA925B|nr:ankyrin repeat domain-containing protein [Treponema sp.]MCR5219097.1 ankyrin repeat domain-containing protein [Treponema sp.]
MKKINRLILLTFLAVASLNCFAKDKDYYIRRYQNESRAVSNLALLYGEDSEFKEALEKKYIDVNYRYKGGVTLFFKALEEYNYEPDTFLKLADYLVKNGADINAASDSGSTPLLYAVSHIGNKNDIRIIEYLLKNKADVKVKDNENDTVLFELCRNKDVDLNLVTKIIKAGAPVNTFRDDTFTPLTYALYNENVPLTKLLVENGADVNRMDGDGRYPLNEACSIGDLSLVKLMVSKGADVTFADDKYKYTPLHLAIRSDTEDSLKLVKFLVEKGADVNAVTKSGYTPIIYAGQNWTSGPEIIKYLADNKADVNASANDGYNVGMSCAVLLDLDCYKFLDKKGFNFNSRDEEGMTPLLYFVTIVTCKNRDEIFYYSRIMEKEKEIAEIIKFLSTKSDINFFGNDRETPLHIACSSLMDYTKIIEALVQNGANVNARGRYGQTPVFNCRKHPGMIKFLIDAGTDLSLRDEYDLTCLDECEKDVKFNPEISASIELLKASIKEDKEYSFVELVEYNYTDRAVEMLKKGIPSGFDDYDSSGYTPLYYAVFNKNLKLAKMILDKGADINKRQKKDDVTVLYLAAEKLNLEMVQLLLKYEPDLSMMFKDRTNETVLSMCAWKYNSYDVVKALLEAGADPDAKLNDEGLTITADLCRGGEEDIIQLLIEYGGDPFATQTSYIRSIQRYETFSIIRKYFPDGSIDYDKKCAVYNGLIKKYKNKTLRATENLRIRSSSDRQSTTITAIRKGTRVKVLDAENMEIIDGIHSCWVKVEILSGSVDSEEKRIPKGTIGWCFLGYLEMEK